MVYDNDDFSPESEQGAFNFGIEYLRTLTYLERALIMAFLENDFTQVHELLEELYDNLFEWMKNDELKEHNDLRAKEYVAHKKFIEAKQLGKKTVPTWVIETYRVRTRALKKLIHKKGLRMPKKDDPAFALSGMHY